MRTFIHTLNTWLVANLVHPVIFIIYFLLLNDREGNNWGAGFFFVGVFSFFLSIPSLLIACFFQYVITNSNFSLLEKYIVWMIAVVGSIVLNFMGLDILFDLDLTGEAYKIQPPSIIAAILSILVRYKQFVALQLNYKSTENENNLV